jgi:nitroimidazol reductase NimA-like FMN-containing flavoprotein (pyridoxamine 5'-phosphate oxidase superfamily)
MALKDYLGEQLLGVLAAYQDSNTLHHICVVYPRRSNHLQIFIPKGHRLTVGVLVTLHLDNRTGVDEFDGNLRVYRTSYKGRVVDAEESWITVEPVEYMLFHGVKVVESHREDGYAFPPDGRPIKKIPPSELQQFPNVESKDNPNKVGVLTTLAAGQPHTTVLAFLSTEADDIFLISMPNTFKSQVLMRESHCFFTIDERAKFTFEQAIEWNYTIIEAQARIVERSSPIYERIRNEFILKNPWEAGFFLSPEIEMFHLKKMSIVYSGEHH